MADYKELLRRAVDALPENNGAARRAVYEKARAALVGQLRAINPPLAARDITAHRLQLEDCIRQVEQEASEAVIAGLGSSREEAPPPPPVYFDPPAKKVLPAAVAKPVAKPPAAPAKEPPRPLPAGGSIEEIIAAANAEHVERSPDQSRAVVRPDKPMGKPVPKLVAQPRPQAQLTDSRRQPDPEPEDEADELPAMPPPPSRPVSKLPVGRPLPSIVARAEAAKSRTGASPFGAAIGGPARGPTLEPRREIAAPRSNQQIAARQLSEPVSYVDPPIAAAMSAVREVDLEPQSVDPQGAIDRAIATLDREARGEADETYANGVDHEAYETEEAEERPARQSGFAPAPDPIALPRQTRDGVSANASSFARDARGGQAKGKAKKAARRDVRPAEQAFPRARVEDDRRGIGAVTIFLIVFAVLLLGAGGAGLWAWREGFINLDAMFGRGPTVSEQAKVTLVTPASGQADAPATGPGNTNTPADTSAPAVELKADDRLAAAPAADTQALPLVDPGKTEERLGATDAPGADSAAAAVASVDPATAAGSQSLLLEAAENGKTGAVPFSGSVDWSKGTDETGLPTLIGKAVIPARNLSVDVLIRKNSDPSLPASHLMEINFRVNDTFIGGSIAGLPGVLLKNEELVQGTPLVGASARVVGNSFLFALSASPSDVAANTGLLTSRKWMDLALIYATGQRAIITLEKDETAQKMFDDVIGAWNKVAAKP
ncbi:hypothetical protein [Devosia sp.]|uniref:hypothetical protein n=1 Tax=Devosia sp. TaxID=1871048 RepID=UPI003BACC8AA